MDFDFIILCEVLLMNYINWKVCFFSYSELIYEVFIYLNVNIDSIEEMIRISENFFNFIFYEFSIFCNYDQFVLSLAVSKMLLIYNDENFILSNFNNMIADLECESLRANIEDCIKMVYYYLDLGGSYK